MSKIISTDVFNYSRKERGEVRIYDDEWEKLAKALDVSVEDIKEERGPNIVQYNDFHDQSANNYYEQYINIPHSVLENLQDFIKILKEQVGTLKEEVQQLRTNKK
ncbi:transcriptional regulator [Chryseobacterium sp.]|uniref:transcriptional regulator n=1 Tax=Chryseobacterium sp. TaxID=1871047 RepID=UPI0025B984BC|nr:transcriptional regulator [Chryseobacterium sp.]